jgi:tRNA U34 5-methylaminomethyl-2-thiouridine-forming methyltransferase MnmC
MSRYRHLPPLVGPLQSPAFIHRCATAEMRETPLAVLQPTAELFQTVARRMAADPTVTAYSKREAVRASLLTARLLFSRARRARRILRRIHA